MGKQALPTRLRIMRYMLTALWVAGLAVGGPGPVAAQNAPLPEGAVVQGPDGALFVVEGGQLHALTPMPASAEQLTTTPRGNPVTTGVMIIPEASAPPPCGEAAGIRLCVLGVERPYVGGFSPQAGFEFALIHVRFENQRDQPFQVRAYEIGLQVQDVRGSTRDWGSGGNTPPIADPITGGFLAPGRALEGSAIIGVPPGVPLTSVIWVLETNPYEAIEAPIP